MIDFDTVLKKANALYAAKKLGGNLGYCAPENMPRILSNQVKCALRALIMELNEHSFASKSTK